MAARLRLVHELIPWSLVIKGVLFAAAWFFLPFWLFVVAAAFLFFRPPFQGARFFPIFLFLLWLTSVLSPQPREIFFVSALFLVSLGIKNLVFVDRALASEVFLVITSFLLWFVF